MTTQNAILIGLAIYAGLMFGVSMFWMVRVKKATDYLVAGRGLPWWILTGTITATSIGTGVVIGASGLAYQHGWAGALIRSGWAGNTLRRAVLCRHAPLQIHHPIEEEIFETTPEKL